MPGGKANIVVIAVNVDLGRRFGLAVRVDDALSVSSSFTNVIAVQPPSHPPSLWATTHQEWAYDEGLLLFVVVILRASCPPGGG